MLERHKPSFGSVAVAICTRDRPEMLRATLHSLAKLRLDGVTCHFIIVENNNHSTAMEIAEEFAGMVGAGRITYCLEPQLGIANARNTALKTALGMNVDALAFIDDDEIADPEWLGELIRTANRDQLDLVGGPVGLLPPPEDASASAKMVWRGLKARHQSIEARSRRHVRRGESSRITITTGNWLADLDFIRRTGLHFDKTFNLSGGEDTAFFRSLREAGGKTGWTASAIVSESQPREQLTLTYQFRRARDQACARHRTKHPNPGLLALVSFCGIALFKIIGGILRIIQSAFDNGASLVRAARAFGALTGIAAALLGHRLNHYATVSGR